MALLSAVLAAVRRTNQKQIALKLNPFTIGFMMQLMALPVIVVALLVYGRLLNPMHLGLHFWLPVLLVAFVFYPLNSYWSMQAIKYSELSAVLPLQSLWPVFSLVPAWLMLGEVPSIIATLGILFTVVGVYVLGLKGRTLHHPWRPFREDRGSRNMLYTVLAVTAAGVLDKIAIKASDAIYYSFASTVGSVLSLMVMLLMYKVREFDKLRQNVRELGFLGTFQGASYTTYLMAIASGPIAYVSAVRGSNVLMGAILGIVLLNEKLTRPKLASFVLIAIGGILLAVGS